MATVMAKANQLVPTKLPPTHNTTKQTKRQSALPDHTVHH